MKECDRYVDHYLVIRCDYKNAEKIERFLNDNDEIVGEFDYNSVVLSSCPHCGDDEFWSGGHCGHCGYDVND